MSAVANVSLKLHGSNCPVNETVVCFVHAVREYDECSSKERDCDMSVFRPVCVCIVLSVLSPVCVCIVLSVLSPVCVCIVLSVLSPVCVCSILPVLSLICVCFVLSLLGPACA
jgi:hypothetical protein